MPERESTAELYDPRNGDQAIRLQTLRVEGEPYEPPRTNCFTILFIESGSGAFWADASQFPFGPHSLLFFVPYQHIRLAPDQPTAGRIVQFHANFLCVETFHAEVGCSGILFNDPYGIPIVSLDHHLPEVTQLLEWLENEDQQRHLAFSEAMLAHLKVLLILATRIKSFEGGACGPAAFDPQHPVLAELRDLIETHYRSLHSPAEYAQRLHVTPKTLGRMVREQLGTTLTELIRNRILIHAKWQLLHTLKPVKEVARELGFHDELYFSRLFKKATGLSPRFFREFETEIRGGSNLSMTLGDAPILDPHKPSDNSFKAAPH